MKLTKKTNEQSKREQVSSQIAALEKERDELIERRRAIQKEIGAILPDEMGGRLKGMRLQALADQTQEYIQRQLVQLDVHRYMSL